MDKFYIRMMCVDIIYLIVIFTVESGVFLETDIISVSNDNVSWENAIRSGHTLLSLDNVLGHGWDSMPKNFSGSRYWIGARATHTPFVSWEGCVQLTGDPECGFLYPGGSIGECIKHCGEKKHYFLLDGSQCRCVHWNNSSCFLHTASRCDNPCPNNPNDWCGGPDDVMSLYNTGPFPYNFSTTNIYPEKNCAVLIERNRTFTVDSTFIYYQPDFCGNSYIRRYVCTNKSSSFAVDNILKLEWLEAHEQCREKGHGLHYYVSRKNMTGTSYWTSLRRSILLKWTKNKDEDFPFCVSLSVDYATLNIHEEPCDKKHRYLYLNGTKEDDASGRWWYPLLVLPIVGLLVIIIFYKVLLTREKSKELKPQETMLPDRPTAFDEHVNNRVDERPNACAPRHMYHTLEIVDCDGKTISNNSSRNNHEMSIYDTTLDIRNRGGVPRLVSDPGSEYNTISRGAVGIVQHSNNIYNTTLCRGFDTNLNSRKKDKVSGINSDPNSVYNTISRRAVGNVQHADNVYNTTLCRDFDTTLINRQRGAVPRLNSDPDSVYNTISRGAVGKVQHSNNVYNTTLGRGSVKNMAGEYVSFNVCGSIRNIDTDV